MIEDKPKKLRFIDLEARGFRSIDLETQSGFRRLTSIGLVPPGSYTIDMADYSQAEVRALLGVLYGRRAASSTSELSIAEKRCIDRVVRCRRCGAEVAGSVDGIVPQHRVPVKARPQHRARVEQNAPFCVGGGRR